MAQLRIGLHPIYESLLLPSIVQIMRLVRVVAAILYKIAVLLLMLTIVSVIVLNLSVLFLLHDLPTLTRSYNFQHLSFRALLLSALRGQLLVFVIVLGGQH